MSYKKDLESKKPKASSSSSNKRKAEDEGVEYLRRKHNFIKSTIRTDYQPDICKDYKETGFCGFGDSCKFLHDRSDYKHGWQLDQEFAKGEYADEDDEKYLIKEDEEDNEDEEDGIPLSCVICRESYKDPIVTKCKHYFCADCAEKECSDKCYACEKSTSGIFKNASKIIEEKKLQRNARLAHKVTDDEATRDNEEVEADDKLSDDSDDN